MEQQVTNFGRFYTSFNALQGISDREDMKRALVMQYTGGRTDSLKEITRKEYESLCSGLEDLTGMKDELRKQRSATLRLLQKLGVDTTDWAQINDFCRNPKIAGKEFARISIDEHEQLRVRLRSIQRKGWQKKPKRPEVKPTTRYTLIEIPAQNPEWN